MKRCGFRAFDGERIWTCLLEKEHDGDCYAARWKVERAFWEDWETETEPEPEYVVEPYQPPAPTHRREIPDRGFAGVKRKRKYRDNVFAGINDYAKTAVNWEGREITPCPTLAHYDLSWRTTL